MVIITAVKLFFYGALFKESENVLPVDDCKMNPHYDVV